MKTLGRIILILFAFALVAGLTYVAINASNSSTGSAAPTSERRDRVSRPDGARPEFRGEGGERGGGWMFGMIKNVGIIAVIVALVMVPKSIRRKRIGTISASA